MMAARFELTPNMREIVLLFFGVLGLFYETVTPDKNATLIFVFTGFCLGTGAIRLDRVRQMKREDDEE